MTEYVHLQVNRQVSGWMDRQLSGYIGNKQTDHSTNNERIKRGSNSDMCVMVRIKAGCDGQNYSDYFWREISSEDIKCKL